jgi:hypothetical protein
MISLAAFTAAQLASALGCTPQAIRQRLEGIPGQKQVTLTGLALAWPFETLPVAMRADLKAIADARRYPDARALLSAPTPAWTPKVPFLQTALAAQAKAAKLQAVMAPALAALSKGGCDVAEIQAKSLAEFEKQFGYTPSARHWQRLLCRTRDRAGVLSDWHRIELYLDDRAGRPAPPSILTRELHQPLQDALETLENKAEPTLKNRAFVCHKAFLLLKKSNHSTPKDGIAGFLKTVSWISSSPPCPRFPKLQKPCGACLNLSWFAGVTTADRWPACSTNAL